MKKSEAILNLSQKLEICTNNNLNAVQTAEFVINYLVCIGMAPPFVNESLQGYKQDGERHIRAYGQAKWENED